MTKPGGSAVSSGAGNGKGEAETRAAKERKTETSLVESMIAVGFSFECCIKALTNCRLNMSVG